jgi:Protein of unknown function (DUF3891)
MVLRPILNSTPGLPASPPKSCVSAWDIVEQLQRQPASGYWLITQPDHAALSGALARSFRSPLLPPVSPEVAQAIEVHDAGWASRDQPGGKTLIALAGNGKPACFLDATPAEFVEAWVGSIEHAARLSPLGGLLVSHHFSRLCQYRLNLEVDPPRETALLRAFLQEQRRKQERLLADATESEAPATRSQIDNWVDLLQFCDLLSLYLCAGGAEPAEFPQRLHGRTVRIAPERGAYILQPSLLSSEETPAKAFTGVSFSVPATRYPPQGKEPKPEMLSFTVR